MFLGAHQNYKFKVFLRVIELSLAASVHSIENKVLKLLQLLTLKLILLRQVFRGVVWSQLSCMVLTSSSQDRLNMARKNLRPTRALIETTERCYQMLIQSYQPSCPLSIRSLFLDMLVCFPRSWIWFLGFQISDQNSVNWVRDVGLWVCYPRRSINFVQNLFRMCSPSADTSRSSFSN